MLSGFPATELEPDEWMLGLYSALAFASSELIPTGHKGTFGIVRRLGVSSLSLVLSTLFAGSLVSTIDWGLGYDRQVRIFIQHSCVILSFAATLIIARSLIGRKPKGEEQAANES